MNLYKPKVYKLDLGTNYFINDIEHKFIQVTRCGFNFLNIKTNKCYFKYHLYKSKCENHKSGLWFFIHNYYKIEKIK